MESLRTNFDSSFVGGNEESRLIERGFLCSNHAQSSEATDEPAEELDFSSFFSPLHRTRRDSLLGILGAMT